MQIRLLALLALLAAFVAAPAGASPLTEYAVPTGGFAVGLPGTWVDVTNAAPSVLKQLEKVPSFRAFARAASTNGALKLIAADPAAKGKVYMDTGVERVGPIPLKSIAAATAEAISRTVTGKSVVTSTKVKLPAGPAYLIHVKGTTPLGTNETDEYLMMRGQVEYVLVYVAPASKWSQYESLFTASANTFKFLQAPDLSGVVLSGSQVGNGYKVAAFPGGTSFIGETTLDLCAGIYPSELLRTGRLQVSYTHPAKTVDVSNEVVTYVSGGAREALAEVTGVARSCSQKAVVKKANGVTTIFRTSPLSDPRLPHGSVVVKLVIKASKGKQHITSTGIAIYQVKGNTLSGVYAFVAKGTTFAQAERVAFHAAEESAHNLSTVSAGTSGGGGSGAKKPGSKGYVA